MRASTLFALTVAVLIGLGVTVAAKLAGIFQAAPAQEPVKMPEIQILAAAHNIFAGDMIDANGVRVRALKAEELPHYQKHKAEYLPPVVQAGALRVTARNILADEPILASSLKELAKPEALHRHLLPNMRAVNLSLLKERSAGGLIQVGDWVDVLLTTTIESTKGKPATRTACVAPKVRVIAKRNTLWPVYAPLPDDKPVAYTLEVNPYRAALLEFVREKGELTMAPRPRTEQQRLEQHRQTLLKQSGDVQQVAFALPDDPEAAEEEARVAAYNRGELVVTEVDLIRIFNLTTPPPPEPKTQVECLGGVRRLDPMVFGADGKVISGGTDQPVTTARASASSPFQFHPPESKCNREKGG